jgi:rfaE bifunctional protein nucleotidyltransferase chain/domain
MKIVWVNGCFDVLHRGHIELFKFAKQKGDFLVIGIDSDNRVRSLKGPSRPINNEEDRKYFLESIKYVDKVVIFNSEAELESAISLHNPQFMVVGIEYKDKNVIGGQFAEQLLFFNRIGNYSTTNILENQ